MPKKKSNPSLTLQLPYPDRSLSPNASKRHWRYKEPAKQAARTEGFYKAVPFRGVFTTADTLQITLTFYPPNKNRRDLDNAHSSMKATIDGVCRGLEIDDSQIQQALLKWGEVTHDGAVELELKGISLEKNT